MVETPVWTGEIRMTVCERGWMYSRVSPARELVALVSWRRDNNSRYDSRLARVHGERSYQIVSKIAINQHEVSSN